MRNRQALAAASALAVCLSLAVSDGVPARAAPGRPAALTGIHKIKHVIVIMQENRSFDSYFGTYPGADGIPPGACLPDPRNGGCVKPYASHQDSNFNEPHGAGGHLPPVGRREIVGLRAPT